MIRDVLIKQDTYLWIMTLKWCGFGSVSYSLFDTVSLNNLKLSKDIHLGANFHTNFAVISNTFGTHNPKVKVGT